jgi:hypothetical protein
MCSQCLSRRIAALGADYGDNDLASGYRQDVLTAPRKNDEDRILAERYIGMARQVEAMKEFLPFSRAFAGELSRVTQYLPLSSEDAVAKLFALHHDHAVQVGKTMLGQMQVYLEEFRQGRLPGTSVIGYAFGQGLVSADKAAAKLAAAAPADKAKPKVAQELVGAMRTFLKKHAGTVYGAKDLNTELRKAGLTTRDYRPSDISAAKRCLKAEGMPLASRSYRYAPPKAPK